MQLSAKVEGRLFAAVTAGRIEQILDNLLANALESHPRARAWTSLLPDRGCGSRSRSAIAARE